MSRPGRPKKPLPPTAARITLAVRALVDHIHGGNLLAASRFAGVPHATLRQLYTGKTAAPSAGTLDLLARAHDLPPGWFLAEPGPAEALPDLDIEGILPPDPERGAMARFANRVRIPLAATALHEVWRSLWDYLRSLPPSHERPIFGGAVEETECRSRLTAFLLAPLLAAGALGESDAVVTESGEREAAPMEDHRRRAWETRLDALGRFWRLALPDLLARAAEARRKTTA